MVGSFLVYVDKLLPVKNGIICRLCSFARDWIKKKVDDRSKVVHFLLKYSSYPLSGEAGGGHYMPNP